MKGLLFTYALTYGGAAVSLVRPFVGLLIFICFAILRPEALWHWSVPAGNYSRIVAVALLVGWLAAGMGSWSFGRARGMAFCLVGFWVWLAVGAAQADYQPYAWERLEAMSKTFLPFLVGLTLIDSVTKVKQLAWVIVLSQGYLALEFNLTYLAGRFDSRGFEHGALDNNGMTILMVSSAGFAFVLGVHATRWWQRGVAFAAALLMVHFVLFSFSRGGMLALAVTCVTAFLLIRKTPKHYLAFAVAAALIFRLAGPEVVERFSTVFADKEQRDTSAESRLVYWTAAWTATTEHPVFGMGPDQWRFRCPAYGIKLGRAAHSTWLEVSADHGFPGLAFLGGFYAICVWRLWPLMRGRASESDPDLASLAGMVIISIIGFVVSAQFVTMHGVDTPYFIALVGAGALRVAPAPATVERPEAENRLWADNVAARPAW